MKQREMEMCRERLEEHLVAVLYPSCERSQQRKWGSVYARVCLITQVALRQSSCKETGHVGAPAHQAKKTPLGSI